MIYFLEFFRDKKNSLVQFVLTIIQFTLCFLIIIFSINQLSLTRYEGEKFTTQYLDHDFYQLVDHFQNDEYYQVEEVNRLKKTYEELAAWEGITYLEFIYQPVSLKSEDVKTERMRQDYGLGNEISFDMNGQKYVSVNSLRINENGIRESGFRVQQGRLFAKEDYEYKRGNRIPVIIGCGLAEKYQLGDRVQGLNLEPDVTFEIIGVLEPDTKVLQGKAFTYVDHYMILPSVGFIHEPDNAEDMVMQKIYYLQKLNGIVKTKWSREELTKALGRLTADGGFQEFDMISYEDSAIEIWGNMSENSIKLLLFLSTITIIFSSVGLAILLMNKFYKNIYEYTVYILSGGTYSTVMKFFFIDVCFILCTSLVLVALLARNYIWIDSMVVIVILALLSIVISLIGPYIAMKKVQLNTSLRRNE